MYEWVSNGNKELTAKRRLWKLIEHNKSLEQSP